MKKLEDIPRKNIFQVPDGYFDKLPGIIQSRVAKESPAPAHSWVWSMRFAVPVVLLMVAGIFWFRSGSDVMDVMDLQAELGQFAPEQLDEYLSQDGLDDDGLTTEELVETVPWSNTDVMELEKSVYEGYDASKQEIETVLDELDN